MVAEMWMDAVARTVGKSPDAVRELNMYQEGQLTHFGQLLEGCQVNIVGLPCMPIAADEVLQPHAIPAMERIIHLARRRYNQILRC